MSSNSGNQHQLGEAALQLPTYVLYGYGDSLPPSIGTTSGLQERQYRIIVTLFTSDANLDIPKCERLDGPPHVTANMSVETLITF